MVPLLVSVVIVPPLPLNTPEPPMPGVPAAAPPLICPEFVRVVIKPVFPTPAAAVNSAPLPPLIVPALLSIVIVPPFATPEPAPWCVPPLPPLIVAPVLLVSDPIVAPLSFSTPAPPVPPMLNGARRWRRCLRLRR